MANGTRFWCPPAGRIALDGEGFLFDPGDPFGEEQTLETYSAIDRHRCLILLGQAGIGKTTEVERAVAAADDRAHYVDLGTIADAEMLRRRVIEAPTVTAWRDGKDELLLFLDAFDEALSERGVLGRALIDELAQLPRTRLRLRIACRTGEWPWSFNDRLAALFADDEVGVYELQPLRRSDVAATAAAAGVDADEFLATVVARGAGPLACVPLTLRFLLDQYARGGTLPNHRAELYREGCRVLCGEQNPSRLETRRIGELSAEDRLAVAERIAAGMVLAGRAAVRLPGAEGDATTVTLAELDGGSERTSTDLVAVASDVAVDQDRLRETLATGLFTSRGDDLLGFAHQSYGEFLTARYVHRHRFDVRRALNLLAQERAGRQRIVPQLRGVAAWLAALDSAFLDWLIANEPELAVEVHLAAVSDERKQELVRLLFARAEEGRLTEPSRRSLARLEHPSLGDQLRPWIADGGAGAGRRLAIEIVGAAGVAELYDLLAELALDADEEIAIRVDAGWALWQTAPAEVRARLKPLALTPIDEDADDDLKGVALLCVWPDALTLDELLPALTPSKRGNYLGAYRLFLGQELIRRLNDADLARMLEWAREVAVAGQHRLFNSLIDDLLVAAWERLDADDIATAFAQLVGALLPHEHRLGAGSYRASDLEQLLRDDRGKRRALVARLVPALIAETIAPYHLVVAAPMVDRDDVRWLLKHATAASDEAEKRAWARLVDQAFRGRPTFEDADAVLTVCEADDVIRAVVQGVHGAVDLDSPGAREAREMWARSREFAAQRAERERQRAEFDAASPLRLEEALRRVERGEFDFYPALDLELLHRPDDAGDGRGSGDLRPFPNWQAADDALRERLVAAAERNLAEGPIDGDPWSTTSHAGYRAARLVLAERGSLDLPRDRLALLIPTMLVLPLAGGDDRAAGKPLLAHAAEQAPDEFVAAVRALVGREAAQHGTVFSLGRLDAVPVGPVDQALAEIVRERRLPTAALAAILEALLERGGTESLPLALELVDRRGDSEPAADLAVAAAALTLVHARDRGPAEHVVAAIGDDSEFGRRVVEWLADRGPLRRRIPELPEDLTADLFLFAAREFGASNHGWPGRDIDSWRSSLLTRLRDSGTEEAHAQLERLRTALPEFEWLARVSEEGEARTIAATWQPPDPQTIIALTASRSQRYVATGGQLLDVVVEALELVQQDLDADPSLANDLWHRRDGGPVPVSEPEACSWLARRLREKLSGERGIIFHREVQIVQPLGPQLGDRTDLHVNAVVQHRDAAAEELTTIVEVKGCWNDDVETALRTQLVERYLRQTATRYGIYVVVWFESARWADDDWRRARCAGRDRTATLDALGRKTRELESQHGVVLAIVPLIVRLP